MNKNFVFSKLCIGIALLGFVACSDDEVSWPEVDGAAPVMELKSDHIRTEQGNQITVKGDLADADGIASVSLVCPTLHLDKTIDLIGIYGEPQKTYKLDYTHPINENVGSIDHKLTVTVTDVGGRTASKEILVTMDADFVAPSFTVVPGEKLNVLIKDPTVLKLKFGIEDNKALKYVKMYLFEGEVKSYEKYLEELNKPAEPETPAEAKAKSRAEGDEGEEGEDEELSDAQLEEKANAELQAWEQYYSQFTAIKSLDVKENELDGKTYSFNEAYPVADEEATYTMVIRAEDKMYHAINHCTVYNVTELIDFEEMFLADVQTAEELNSDVFGVPILIDHVDAFEYEARYYNATAGTEICFLPQETDFSPICFAPSKDDPTKLGDDIDEVDKFKLDQAGVYYHFHFNTMTREFSYETYSIADAHDPVENMTPGANHLNHWQAWGDEVGKAEWVTFTLGVMAWSNDLVAELKRDKTNPHIMRTEPFKREAGDLGFYIGNFHDDGWWGYTEWRTDNEKKPHKCMYLGMWFDDNPQFKGNDAYFNWKYGDVPGFTKERWNTESGYKNNFVTDTWFKPYIKKKGNYVFEVDFHTEACRLVPAK